MLSLVPSGVGLFLFMYGKKQERLAYIAAGIVLMVYPYFVTNRLWMGGIGILLCLVPLLFSI